MWLLSNFIPVNIAGNSPGTVVNGKVTKILSKVKKIGIPTSSSESYDLLARKQIIPSDLAEKLKKMVGFRNISVHEYQKIDYAIVISVIEKELGDLIRFTDRIMDLD